jgi:peptide/nickel transport system substrate-binding protein
MDFARIPQLYNSPVEYGPDGVPRLALAQELTPNADASEWTLRLREGVTFHNGKDLSADDVIFSLQRIVDPKNPLPGASQLATLDVKGLRKLDNLTVRIPFTSGFSPLPQVLAGYYCYIVPVGYDPKNPVGTGPFKFESFTPGQQSVFIRNNNYWEEGLPYVDRLIMSNYDDETSQVNALISGVVDLIDHLSATSIQQVRGGGQVVTLSPGAEITPFVMRVDQPPWNDVRVRQAMRLIVDREQMRQVLFAGNGSLGNDLWGINDPAYDHSIPQRQQDIEQAKSLLAAAGQSGLTVQLTTAPIGQGTVAAAQVFAQQAQAAGVTVKLNSVPVGTLFGSNYLQWNFTQDIWFGLYYMSMAGESSVPGAPFNETHINNPRYNSLYRQVLSEPGQAQQVELIHEMQQIDYTEGGYIIPYFVPAIDAVGTKVRNAKEGRVGLPFGGWALKQVWLD